MISRNFARRTALAAGLLLVTAASADAQRASPRDTVRATISGATILVDYSRPAMRGRDIFGGLVPWNQPWRTGADLPTTLITDQPLLIGGQTLPAGSHALNTLPTPTGWKLIVMKEIPRWGIPYPGEDHDLFRVDMTVTRLDTPVEQMTIRLESAGQGGVLHVEWDRTRASIPFTVRR
jgi:hypothetical protein